MDSIRKLSSKIWLILPYDSSEDGKVEINWDRLINGPLGTKHQKEYLRRSAKEFFEAKIRFLEQRYGRLSPHTVAKERRQLWRLVSWMTSIGVWRFSQLTVCLIADYHSGASSGRGNDEAPLRRVTQRMKLSVFSDLWRLRQSYTSPLRFDPDSQSLLLRLSKTGTLSEKWKPIPLETVKDLMSDALMWLETGSPLVIKLANLIYSDVGSTVGLSRKKALSKISSAYASQANTHEFRNLVDLLRGDAMRSVEVLRTARDLTFGACIFILLMVTGMRISELRSLRRNCLLDVVHDNGISYTYIEGVAAKKKGLNRRWIAPDIAKKCIGALREITGNMSSLESDHLFNSVLGNVGFPRAAHRYRRQSAATLARLMISFAKSNHRTSLTTLSTNLHPHRCRKTFAKFVVTRDKRGLGALTQHYGHLYSSVLDNSYVGADIEMAELLSTENVADLAAGLTDILTSQALGGKARLALKESRSKVSQPFQGKILLGKMVNELIEKGVKLAPCDWGYCLYDSSMSACRGSREAPNPVNRCPSVCSSCSNFVITEKYRSWWEARMARDVQFSKRSDLPKQTELFVESRIRESRILLTTLNNFKYNRQYDIEREDE